MAHSHPNGTVRSRGMHPFTRMMFKLINLLRDHSSPLQSLCSLSPFAVLFDYEISGWWHQTISRRCNQWWRQTMAKHIADRNVRLLGWSKCLDAHMEYEPEHDTWFIVSHRLCPCLGSVNSVLCKRINALHKWYKYGVGRAKQNACVVICSIYK